MNIEHPRSARRTSALGLLLCAALALLLLAAAAAHAQARAVVLDGVELDARRMGARGGLPHAAQP